jgi:hypothetical protein
VGAVVEAMVATATIVAMMADHMAVEAVEDAVGGEEQVAAGDTVITVEIKDRRGDH